MSDSMSETVCSFCGGAMELGYAQSRVAFGWRVNAHRDDSHLIFIVPGERTSANPMTAFRQGIEEHPSDRKYIIRGRRCTNCARLEWFAEEQPS